MARTRIRPQGKRPQQLSPVSPTPNKRQRLGNPRKADDARWAQKAFGRQGVSVEGQKFLNQAGRDRPKDSSDSLQEQLAKVIYCCDSINNILSGKKAALLWVYGHAAAYVEEQRYRTIQVSPEPELPPFEMDMPTSTTCEPDLPPLSRDSIPLASQQPKSLDVGTGKDILPSVEPADELASEEHVLSDAEGPSTPLRVTPGGTVIPYKRSGSSKLGKRKRLSDSRVPDSDEDDCEDGECSAETVLPKSKGEEVFENDLTPDEESHADPSSVEEAGSSNDESQKEVSEADSTELDEEHTAQNEMSGREESEGAQSSRLGHIMTGGSLVRRGTESIASESDTASLSSDNDGGESVDIVGGKLCGAGQAEGRTLLTTPNDDPVQTREDAACCSSLEIMISTSSRPSAIQLANAHVATPPRASQVCTPPPSVQAPSTPAQSSDMSKSETYVIGTQHASTSQRAHTIITRDSASSSLMQAATTTRTSKVPELVSRIATFLPTGTHDNESSIPATRTSHEGREASNNMLNQDGVMAEGAAQRSLHAIGCSEGLVPDSGTFATDKATETSSGSGLAESREPSPHENISSASVIIDEDPKPVPVPSSMLATPSSCQAPSPHNISDVSPVVDDEEVQTDRVTLDSPRRSVLADSNADDEADLVHMQVATTTSVSESPMSNRSHSPSFNLSKSSFSSGELGHTSPHGEMADLFDQAEFTCDLHVAGDLEDLRIRLRKLICYWRKDPKYETEDRYRASMARTLKLVCDLFSINGLKNALECGALHGTLAQEDETSQLSLSSGLVAARLAMVSTYPSWFTKGCNSIAAMIMAHPEDLDTVKSSGELRRMVTMLQFVDAVNGAVKVGRTDLCAQLKALGRPHESHCQTHTLALLVFGTAIGMTQGAMKYRLRMGRLLQELVDTFGRGILALVTTRHLKELQSTGGSYRKDALVCIGERFPEMQKVCQRMDALFVEPLVKSLVALERPPDIPVASNHNMPHAQQNEASTWCASRGEVELASFVEPAGPTISTDARRITEEQLSRTVELRV